jgi:protein ImuA
MNEPTALSVMCHRAAVAEELRRLLPKMEGSRAVKFFATGLAAIDRCLPQGGLACGGLHEFVPEEGAMPATYGFMTALLARWLSNNSVCSPPPTREQINRQPILFVLPAYGLRDYGRPHGHGLSALGLDPGRLILVETAHRKDTLWAMEEGLRSRAPAAVAGAIDKLDLKTSQRLQLVANDAGLPLFLLRPLESLESSAAATRWRVGPLAAARDRFGLIGHARWRLALARCRNGRTGEWMVEYDHVAHRFSLAAALADPAFAIGAGEKAFRHAC